MSQLSACDVVSLVTNKSLKRVENFQRYVIFSCYYSLILQIKWFLVAVFTHYLDYTSNGFTLRIVILFILFRIEP